MTSVRSADGRPFSLGVAKMPVFVAKTHHARFPGAWSPTNLPGPVGNLVTALPTNLGRANPRRLRSRDGAKGVGDAGHRPPRWHGTNRPVSYGSSVRGEAALEFSDMSHMLDRRYRYLMGCDVFYSQGGVDYREEILPVPLLNRFARHIFPVKDLESAVRWQTRLRNGIPVARATTLPEHRS